MDNATHDEELSLKRSIKVYPAFDKRNPDSKKNYGVGSATVQFAVVGKEGVVSYSVFSGWYLPHIEKEWKTNGTFSRGVRHMSAGCNYHSRVPQYEGHTPIKNCTLLDGDACYCDGTSITNDLWLVLLEGGDEELFDELEIRYNQHFRQDGV